MTGDTAPSEDRPPTPTRVVVPFDATEPKTRLAPALDADERRSLARRMLADVLVAIRDASPDTDHPPDVEVIATDTVDLDLSLDSGSASRSDSRFDVTVTVDDRPLSVVVNDAIVETFDGDGDGDSDGTGRDGHDPGESTDALGVVMADLALATPAAVGRLFATPGDVVLAPGRGVGTNALVVRTADFRVDFHGASYLDHRRAATDAGATVETVDSFRLATDVDEPADLVEALVHGTGRAAAWLDARFDLAVDDDEGRVTLTRR